MKAIRITKYGDAHCLELQHQPKPTPNAGEVLVRLKAIGLNFIDIYMRKGDPMIPGSIFLTHTSSFTAKKLDNPRVFYG